MSTTKIEWTRGDDGTPGKTWNPLRGCSKVSAGCKHCYAETMAMRFSKPGLWGHGVADANGWTGKVVLAPEKTLTAPLRWRKPCRVFVNSTSDLFHERVAFEWMALIFAVMALSPQHTFQCLTKRPARMRRFVEMLTPPGESRRLMADALGRYPVDLPKRNGGWQVPYEWPLPNVHVGFSASNQETFDARVDDAVATPAAVTFVSLEPMLGPVDLTGWFPDRLAPGARWADCLCAEIDPSDVPCVVCEAQNGIDWVICGGESGPGARPFDLKWARSVRDQCADAGIAFFLKQTGAWPMDTTHNLLDAGSSAYANRCATGIHDKKGGDPSEWPDDLRTCRAFPASPQQPGGAAQ